jgi:hypothetical protein
MELLRVSSHYFDIIRTEREDVEKAGDKKLKNEIGGMEMRAGKRKILRKRMGEVARGQRWCF